jgi:hypothetical protein
MKMEAHNSLSRRLFIGAGLTSIAAGSAAALNAPPAATNDSEKSEGKANQPDLPKAFIDGTGQGWQPIGKKDLIHVNSAETTWTWRNDGVLACTGKPKSVIRTQNQYTNFEFVATWRHLRNAGNSGFFVWTSPASIKKLTDKGTPGLPDGIEVQVLDTGYTEFYKKKYNKKPNWFTCHGDVFSVRAKMKPFPPVGPKGSRSFPTENRSKDFGNWNHYYIRAINGEVRLWVNGKEVSGGTNCQPATGYFCIESEGAPIEFKDMHLRVLP